MKILFKSLAFVCLFAALAVGQNTATVTGHIADPGSTSVSSRTFVRATLSNTGGQQCKISGTALVSPYVRDFTPNVTGDLSFSLYKSSVITCGTTTGASRWVFNIWRDGKPTFDCALQITGNTDLTSAACLNASSTPVTVTPTDSVYCRIDGSNCGFTGNVTHNAHDNTGIGTLGLTEQAAPSGAASNGLIWEDSTAHRPKVNPSNSGATTLALFTDPLSVFASTTSAQLAGVISDETGSGAAVFANGNTQDSPTFTTKFSITETTAPSGSAGKDVCYGDSTAHAVKCSFNNGTFGQAVLDNATQTLTGKTLTGAGSGNSVNLLNDQGVLTAVTGTGAFANIYTFTIPANTIQAGKGISIKVAWAHTTGTASVSYKVVLGSTTIVGPFSSSVNGAGNVFSVAALEVFNNSGVQNAQHGSYDYILIGTTISFGASSVTASENTANALALSVQFNVANTDQITPLHFRVALIQ